MADTYTCTLTDASLEKAKKELNEDPNNRLSSVRTMREWCEQQPHIKCITSTDYLLRYLRTAKFSQLRARELIEGNLTLRTNLSQWYHDVDPHNPEHLHALKLGVLLPLPGYDKEGRKVIIARQGSVGKDIVAKLAKDRMFKNNYFKSMLMTMLNLISDENTLVNGILYINDFTGYSMGHFNAWSLADIKDLLKWQGNSPGRFKKLLYYNTGPVFESLMEIIKPFIGKKFKDRMKVLGSNLENLYKEVPMEMLPEEYLPDDYTGPNAGSIQNISENTIKELQRPEVRERIVHETSSQWRVDMKLKDAETATSSFRKLNID